MKRSAVIKGLILHDFYAAASSIVIIMISNGLVGVVLLITGYQYLSGFFATLGILVVSCSVIINCHRESISKWNRLQLALPVKRSDVIASKYIGFLILLFAGMISVGCFLALGAVLHESLREVVVKDIGWTVNVAIMACAVFYPVSNLVSTNKEEILAVICMLCGLAFEIGVNFALTVMKFPAVVHEITLTSISVILLAVSYVVTKRIYADKDI